MLDHKGYEVCSFRTFLKRAAGITTCTQLQAVQSGHHEIYVTIDYTRFTRSQVNFEYISYHLRNKEIILKEKMGRKLKLKIN